MSTSLKQLYLGWILYSALCSGQNKSEPVKLQPAHSDINCNNYTNVPIPKFHEDLRAEISPHNFTVKMWLAETDFTEDRVTSVACSFVRKYGSEHDLFVRMFDSKRAAKIYDYHGGNGPDIEDSLRAYLTITKDGKTVSSVRWWPNKKDREHPIEITLY